MMDVSGVGIRRLNFIRGDPGAREYLYNGIESSVYKIAVSQPNMIRLSG